MALSRGRSTPAAFQTLDWYKAYRNVLQESDTNTLFRHVEVAEAAMRLRRETLSRFVPRGEEWRAIERALDRLDQVKRERLGFREARAGNRRESNVSRKRQRLR